MIPSQEKAAMDRIANGYRVSQFLAYLKQSPLTAMRYVFPIEMCDADKDAKNEHECEMRAYTYIPYGESPFVQVINYAKGLINGDVHFIDCGCGPGEKVFLAKYACDVASATGIEYNEMTYNLGRFFLGQIPYCNLIHGDAFEFDFRPYNLVYLYHPIYDDNTLWELYQHIWDTMPVGGVFVEVLLHDEHYYKCKGYDIDEIERVQDEIYDLPDGSYCLDCWYIGCEEECDYCSVTQNDLDELRELYGNSGASIDVPDKLILRKTDTGMEEVEE